MERRRSRDIAPKCMDMEAPVEEIFHNIVSIIHSLTVNFNNILVKHIRSKLQRVLLRFAVLNNADIRYGYNITIYK